MLDLRQARRTLNLFLGHKPALICTYITFFRSFLSGVWVSVGFYPWLFTDRCVLKTSVCKLVHLLTENVVDMKGIQDTGFSLMFFCISFSALTKCNFEYHFWKQTCVFFSQLKNTTFTSLPFAGELSRDGNCIFLLFVQIRSNSPWFLTDIYKHQSFLRRYQILREWRKF